MMKTRYYEEKLEHVSEEDIKRTRAFLYKYALQNVSREKLSISVKGKFNSSTDRTVRRCIDVLRDHGEIILSDSGHGGYCLIPKGTTLDPKQIEQMKATAGEWLSRARKLEKKSRELLAQAEQFERLLGGPQQIGMGI
jgi:biotin operon repressor